MTINERMTAAGVPGRPYTIADQLDWAADRIAELEAALAAECEKQPHECDECSTVAALKKALVAAKDEAKHFMELARKNALDFIEVNEQLVAARHQLVLQQYQYETNLELIQKGVRDAHEREKYIKKQLDTLKFVMETNPPKQETTDAND